MKNKKIKKILKIKLLYLYQIDCQLNNKKNA